MRLSMARMAIALGGAAGAVGIAAVVAVGCGGDDNVVPPPGDGGGFDNTAPDVRNDNYVPPNDQYVPDTNVADNYNPDNYAVPPDAGIDAPTLGSFIHESDEAYCQSLGQCCTTPPLGYPQNWNQDGDGGCVQAFDSTAGWDFLIPYAASLNNADVTYNPQQAAQCIYDLQQIYQSSTQNSCGVVQANYFNNILSDCYKVFNGTVTPGGNCVTSLDCANGFCQLGPDAGPGTCAALVALGSACSVDTYNTSLGPTPVDDQCTYLGAGTPNNFCTGALPGGNGTGVCAAGQGLDAGCTGFEQCQLPGSTCGFSGTCEGQYVFSDPGIAGGECATYTVVDAGAD